jgi:hypothetical protein
MQFGQFKASVKESAPPANVSAPLTALWYAARGDWEKAHAIAQDIPTPEGSWVHAWLHRQEGDQNNAHYWYVRAGRPMPQLSLEEEWETIVTWLLARAG